MTIIQSIVAFYRYTFDAASRITQIVSVDGTASYGYDNRGELTSADYTNPNLSDEFYRYDASGNRLESHLHGTGYQTGPATASHRMALITTSTTTKAT